MLDTCICSYIMREHPIAVLEKLSGIASRHKIVISAITYAEMRFGAIGKKASPKHTHLVDEFVKRLDAIFAWDMAAVDATVGIKKYLADSGMPIGANDTAIAGHALATGSILVTNNLREFSRVPSLQVENWG